MSDTQKKPGSTSDKAGADEQNEDTAAAVKAKGREEKARNDAELEQAAEVKQDEQAAHEADPDKPEGKEPPSADQLRGEIAETREELGDTVEALAAKADVKGQAKDKVDDAKARAEEQKDRAQAKANEAVVQAKDNPTPFAAAAAGILGLLIAVLLLRRRR